MALIPIHHPWMDIADDPLWPSRRGFGMNFGLGVPQEVRRELWNMENEMNRLMSNVYGGTRGFLQPSEVAAQAELDRDKFKVSLDVSHFRPEDVTVKQVDNNLLVEGKHEERQDPHGFVSRTFTRRYVLPNDIKAEGVRCEWSPNGLLTIEAPRLALPASQARQLPITNKAQGQP